MNEIRIGVKGLVTAGDHIGRYIIIQESEPGYQIFFSDKENFEPDPYDNWILKEELESYFHKGHQWKVQWSDERLYVDPGSGCVLDPDEPRVYVRCHLDGTPAKPGEMTFGDKFAQRLRENDEQRAREAAEKNKT